MAHAKANTSAGLTPFRSIDLDESEEAVKGSPGFIYFVRMHNLAAARRYVKFYDATVTGTIVGTTTPTVTIPMEANSGEVWDIPEGWAFTTAITVAATTALADNDTGAPSAGDVVINVLFA